MTIEGPSYLSQSSTYYPLTATIHYHPDDHAGGAVAFSTRSSPVTVFEALEFHYKLYRSEDVSFDNMISFRRSRPWIRPHEARKSHIRLPISQESGFEEIMPGETKSFHLRLQLDYWLPPLKVGTKYSFRYRGHECAIPYWRHGTLQV